MIISSFLPMNVLAVVDVSFITIGVMALLGIVPAITAVMSMVYVGIRLYETDTIQCLLYKRHCYDK